MAIRWLGAILLGALALVSLTACGSSSSSSGGGGGDDAPAKAATGDTGRMSEGEWQTASDAVQGLNHEIADYRNKVADRCRLLLEGGEIKDTLDCLGEAFDGVEGQAGLTFQTLDDMKGDVAKKCRTSVVRAAQLVDGPLYQALVESKRALDSLDNSEINPAIKDLNRQDARWSNASGDMLVLCSPQ